MATTKKTKTTNNEANTQESNMDMTNETTTNTEAAPERDINFAQFHVSVHTKEGTNAEVDFGPTFDVLVTREKRGVYVATLDFDTGNSEDAGAEGRAKSAGAAVNKLLTELGVTGVTHSANEVEREEAAPMAQEGVNESAAEESYFFNEVGSEAAKEAARLVGELSEAAASLDRADADARKSWVAFGRGYNAAKALFNTQAGEGEKGKAAWGQWLRTAFAGAEAAQARLESKNAAAQAGFMASAPEAVVEAVGANTASTFEKNVNRELGDMARQIAESFVKEQEDAFDAEGLLNQSGQQRLLDHALAWFAKSNEQNAAAVAKWEADFEAAKEKIKQGKPFAPLAPAVIKSQNVMVIMAWLFNLDAEGHEALAFHTSQNADGKAKLNKGMEKLVKEAESEFSKPTEEEAAATAAEKAVSEAVKKFPALNVKDAVQHLLSILVSHEKAGDILGLLQDEYDNYVTAQDEKDAERVAAEEQAAV